MKRLFIFIMGVMMAVVATSRTFDMKQLGADAKGIKPCTKLINQTIEKAASEGGGTIYFPAGTYLTATIHMKSNITLHLESGAIVRFSDRFEDYLPFVTARWEGTVMQTLSPLIYAHSADNLTITGRGTLDGNGLKWWLWEFETRKVIKENGGKLPSLDKLQQMWVDANKDLEISDYYKPSLERKMFRPPFIQFYECTNILIENVKIINSPFWTVNPAFCDNVTIHGVTINNPSSNPKGPNTDGINPSSCRNVRISDCFISVGDDCITIKSGRDADGRKYGKACENITITNCIMLSGHGGVVIGSEMSGGVKRIAISNCVFDGTNAGIRLKASRGRGGVVEDIRVDNIVMKNIQGDAFIFDLFYDRLSKVEPVSERTPIFRNIHLSNVTGNDIKRIGYIKGIEEMPISELSFSNMNIVAGKGFQAETATDIRFNNVSFTVEEGPSLNKLSGNNRRKTNRPLKKIYNMAHRFLKLSLVCMAIIASTDLKAQQAPVLWYDSPAEYWEEALPLGNGRLGAMVYGNPVNEEIQLNEETISAGAPYKNYNPETKNYLSEIRQLIFEGKYPEAQTLAGERLLSKNGFGMPYQTAGSLRLRFQDQEGYTNFRRELDLEKAVASTTYTVDGVDYKREVFTSFADQLVIIRLTASQPGKLTFTTALTCPQDVDVTTSGKDAMTMEGVTKGNEFVEGAVRFRTDLKLNVQGGKTSANDSTLIVTRANSATIYLAISTNFINYKDISGDPVKRNKVYLKNAGKNYTKALQAHISEYQKYYNRVSLNLGRTAQADKPTDIRVKEFATANDPHLVALYFQFGRYLLISSSQPGG